MALGTINANLFQDVDYKLGSVTDPGESVRRKAIDHLLECIEMRGGDGKAQEARSVVCGTLSTREKSALISPAVWSSTGRCSSTSCSTVV